MDKTSIRNKIKTQFVNTVPSKLNHQDTRKNLVAKIPLPIPARLLYKQLEEVKKQIEQRQSQGKNIYTKSYAQTTTSAADILKLRDAFPALPNKKIIKICSTTLNKPMQKDKRIQYTTKGPSRKQAIVPFMPQYSVLIMNNTSQYIGAINSLLKGLKSTLHAEFIWPSVEGIVIATNNVPASSNLTTIKKYIKSIEGISQNEVAAPHLPQSKSYLKIIGIPFIQPSSLALTSDNITNFIRNSDMFENITLAL